MQLPEGQRSIISFFPSGTRASGASKEIIQAGLVSDSEAISVDRVSSYGVSYNHEMNSPINHTSTISGPTLYGADSGGANPLLAASDSASGMASDGAGIAGGEAFMLTVVTADANVDRAVGIIKKFGGRV
ncbi:MAG: hypothetical protein GXY34_01340 [Syntrophomonadaceae bacterium]|nr:hypothetical protein [Syntrophomonadaceae bacterium]